MVKIRDSCCWRREESSDWKQKTKLTKQTQFSVKQELTLGRKLFLGCWILWNLTLCLGNKTLLTIHRSNPSLINSRLSRQQALGFGCFNQRGRTSKITHSNLLSLSLLQVASVWGEGSTWIHLWIQGFTYGKLTHLYSQSLSMIYDNDDRPPKWSWPNASHENHHIEYVQNSHS